MEIICQTQSVVSQVHEWVVYKLGSLLGSVGHRVKIHKITSVTGKKRGDIEIKDYGTDCQGQDWCVEEYHRTHPPCQGQHGFWKTSWDKERVPCCCDLLSFKINMVQVTRLYNLLSYLVDTCGQFRCKWRLGLGTTCWLIPSKCM